MAVRFNIDTYGDDPQLVDMIHLARRWLDKKGFAFLRVGEAAYCLYSDSLVFVEQIGLGCDNPKTAPYISCYHIEGKKLDLGRSMLRPSDFCAVTDEARIERSRAEWNRDRTLYRHDQSFVFTHEGVVRALEKLVKIAWGKHYAETNARWKRLYKKEAEKIWRLEMLYKEHHREVDWRKIGKS